MWPFGRKKKACSSNCQNEKLFQALIGGEKLVRDTTDEDVQYALDKIEDMLMYLGE